MGISNEQWKALTESRFYKPEIGRTDVITFRNWRFENRRFKGEGDERPLFVADLITLNGELQSQREFNTGNKALCRLLMPLVQDAERQGAGVIRLKLQRTSQNDYTIISWGVV